MRLGLLGGTFDPIHLGHLELAKTALHVARLDAIHFVTSVNPPHKSEKTQANFLDRHAMVALALKGDSRLIPSSVEFDREGKSYSIDTVLAVEATVRRQCGDLLLDWLGCIHRTPHLEGVPSVL